MFRSDCINLIDKNALKLLNAERFLIDRMIIGRRSSAKRPKLISFMILD